MISERMTRIHEDGIICVNQHAERTCICLVYNEDWTDIKALHFILNGERGIKSVPLMNLTNSPNLMDIKKLAHFRRKFVFSSKLD